MAEWLKARAWKVREPERVPRVRIPLSPPPRGRCGPARRVALRSAYEEYAFACAPCDRGRSGRGGLASKPVFARRPRAPSLRSAAGGAGQSDWRGGRCGSMASSVVRRERRIADSVQLVLIDADPSARARLSGWL